SRMRSRDLGLEQDGLLLCPLYQEAKPDEHCDEHRKGSKAYPKSHVHLSFEASPATGDDRAVLPAPPLHAAVDDRQIAKTWESEERRHLPLHVPAAAKGPEGKGRGKHQSREQGRGQPRIPSPPDSPSLAGPEWPRREHDDAEKESHLGTSHRKRVPPGFSFHE